MPLDHATASHVLANRYTVTDTHALMSGLQALVRLPMDVRRADVDRGEDTAAFISGYEGSPLGGYDLELARTQHLLDELDIVFRPGLNEELALTAVQGTQLVSGHADARVEGITGYWYGKAPGLDRAADALRHANLMGTHPRGGALVLVGDDPSAKSSTAPSASEGLLAEMGIPVLYPADSQEILDLGRHAVAMSRLSGLWVALKIVTSVADGTSTVELDAGRIKPVNPEVSWRGRRFHHRPSAQMAQPLLTEMEATREGISLEAARAYIRANNLNRIETVGTQPTVGIVSAGKTYIDVRHALTLLGLDRANRRSGGVRLLRLGASYPLLPEEISEFAAGLDTIIVVEEKRPLLEAAVKEALYRVADAPRVTGKKTTDDTPLFSVVGELDPDSIASGLRRELGRRAEFAAELHQPKTDTPSIGAGRELTLVPRTPYFCSGCPHNSSTKVPSGSVVGAGIGCHALVLLMNPETVGELTGLTQMGGEGAQWIGMAPFRRTQKHMIQNMGDGTLQHSGSLAIRAAVAAGIDITYKILYNSAVAMTGGQAPVGSMSVPALTAMLRAEGVKQIIVTTEDSRRYRGVRLGENVTVWPRTRLMEAQETLRQVPGVTVLIHDQECASELRRKRTRGLAPAPATHVLINERICEGCGDCGRKSNCLSVQPVDTEFGRKTAINQSSCNADYSCLDGDCPSFMTVRIGSPSRPRAPRAPTIEGTTLPQPRHDPHWETSVHVTRITGIGGTGIVTVSQLLAISASLAGLHARTSDQTGLAQKGGAVISDVVISKNPITRSNKATAGGCDVYLGCDLLVAADSKNLAVSDPSRTIAVVSTALVPTGEMVAGVSVDFPHPAVLSAQIAAATHSEHTTFVDARKVSKALFGSEQYANVFLVGVAFQSGALPLPAAALEQAIELNGVQIELNQQALRRGRQYVADRHAFDATLDAMLRTPPPRRLREAEREMIRSVGASAGSELERLLSVRVPDLVDYQNFAYAARYVAAVAHTYQAEQAYHDATELSEAVARYLHKLMAYKDEYEVARLSLDASFHSKIRREFGAGAQASYKLHPPALRALGMQRKLTLGPGFRYVLIVLRAMKRLRGTAIDPFGYAHVRRVERALIQEYCETISGLLPRLDERSVGLITEIASLPEMIRGYEAIKLAAVRRYHARLRELLAELSTA